MMNIYSVFNYEGHFIGVYKTDKTLEEKKEELINSLLLTKKPYVLVDSLDTNRNYSFELKLIKQVTTEEANVECKRISEEYIELRKEDLPYQIQPEILSFKRLQFNDNWVTFSRPTLLTNAQNPILKELVPTLDLEMPLAIEIIKELSNFAIINMEKKMCTRIPYIGAFKIKRSLAVEHLNNPEYGTSNYRRRKQFRDRQDMDKNNSEI